MADLLKEAIANAKTVKAAALANAKIALEETFQPTLQRMISNKIMEEEGEEEFETPEGEVDIDINYGGEEEEGGDMGFGSFEDEEEPAPEGEGEDLELESLIRELEGGDEDEFAMEEEYTADDFSDPIDEGEEEFEDDMLESFLSEMDDEEEMFTESEDEEMFAEGEDWAEEEMAESILREIENLGDLNGPNHEDGAVFTEPEPSSTDRNLHLENRRLRNKLKASNKKLNESLRAITTYKQTINEVNLLNAKLMYTTKTLRQFNLNENQQVRILESFDRANTVREVKLVYTTIVESFNKKAIKENKGLASKAVKQVNPKQARKNTLTEGVLNTNTMVSRFQQLAGIKSTDNF